MQSIALTLAALAALVSLPQQPPAPDEPETPSGLVVNEPEAFEGYTLFAPLRDTVTYLIDMEGRVVHRWDSPGRPGNAVLLTEAGHLIRCLREENPVMTGGGQGGRIVELDWDGNLLWDWSLNDEQSFAHHDVARLANGNLLVIAWEWRSAEAALAAGRDPAHVTEVGFWPDVVHEVRPIYPRGDEPSGAEIVWTWRSFDHLVQDRDPELANYGSPADHPGRIDVNGEHRGDRPLTAEERERIEEQEAAMRALGYLGGDEPEDDDDEPGAERERTGREGDWLHTNAIDHRADLDLIVLSVRSFNEVWVIDHSTTTEEASGSTGGRWGRGGELLFRYGNPRVHGAGEEEDRALFHQHDARWIPGTNRLTVFNNGDERPGEPWSSVDEIELALEPGSVHRASEGPELVWTYEAPERETFYSSFISGAERLPNGNTLICEGAKGRLFEVTGEGRIVWEYWNPFGQHPSDGEPGPGGPPGRGGPPDGQDGERGRADRGPGPGPGPGRGPGRGRGPRDEGGPPPDAERGRRSGMAPGGLFRAARLAPDHPGLAGRDLAGRDPGGAR